MNTEQELLEKINELLNKKRYRVRLHAVRHMIEEGFSEDNILEAVSGKSKILENYSDDLRCLIVGYFRMTAKVQSPLHIVCDYSNADIVDIVTAYIPQKPWWSSPIRRGRIL
ncbi:MAG: DUF4258 domain-containing protein [Pyrinomonadaceae bacterium]